MIITPLKGLGKIMGTFKQAVNPKLKYHFPKINHISYKTFTELEV
jgi:hypothetical protein